MRSLGSTRRPGTGSRTRTSSSSERDRTWLGVDMGVRNGTTAIAVVQLVDDEVRARVKILEGGAESVPLGTVEQAIRDLAGIYDLRSVIYDSRGFQRSADLLEAEGLPMIEFPQSPERMVLASATLYKLVEEKKLRHDGDPALRAQVLAGRVKELDRGWRFVKDPTMPRPIDALFALAVACHIALDDVPKRSVYENEA